MLQRIYRQICETDIEKEVYIVTSSAQADVVRNQIGQDVEVIIEPERRNTFPAIAIAAAFLAFEEQVDLNETIMILPVDTYVEKEYFEQLVLLEDAVQNGA